MTKKVGPASEARLQAYDTMLALHADGKQYKEIAEACGVPIGTVRSTIYRARQHKGILPTRRKATSPEVAA